MRCDNDRNNRTQAPITGCALTNGRRMKTGASMALALLLAALVVPEPQAGPGYRIGFLGRSSPADYAANLAAFRQGLRDLGYEEGKNISIEYRWAGDRYERLPALAVELVRLHPDVLVTHAASGIRAAQQATSTVAVLANLASVGTQEVVRETEVAARKLGVGVRSFAAKNEPAGLEAVFTAILRERPDGLIVIPDSLFVGDRNASIHEFAARNNLPAMGGERRFVADGGLISYGSDFSEGWRLAARYVNRILKGAKPAELPIEQPTKFELAINLKTARRLGLTMPPSLLLRANQVIE